MTRAGGPDRVQVEIGVLVLDGFDRRVDPDQVSAAFTAELDRLIRRDGVRPVTGGADRELDLLGGLPPLARSETTSPDRLGVALARSVHAGLSGPGDDGQLPDDGGSSGQGSGGQGSSGGQGRWR
jgi:hypothetical protein